MAKSKEELESITNECYEICDASHKANDSRDFFDYVDDYLLSSYPELTFDEKNEICETIEDIVNNTN